MSETLNALGALWATEEFFDFFALTYDPAVVQVNRLHILKRFNQYLRMSVPPVTELAADAQSPHCRALLLRAYEDFIRSTPAQEKVFKVFQDADGSHVGVEGLRNSLPSHKGM